MLIIQIALGIVLGFLILRFLPQIIALGGYLLLAAIVLAVIGFGAYFLKENPETIQAALAIVLFCISLFYGICLIGVLVQNLPAIRKISSKDRTPLKDIKETNLFKRYNLYLLDRFVLGCAAGFIFSVLATISSFVIGGTQSLTSIIAPVVFFAFLALLRYGEIRNERKKLANLE